MDEQVKKEEVDVNKLRENYQKLRRELHDLNEQIYQIRHQKEKDTDSLSKLELTLAEFLSGEKEIRSVLNQKCDRQLLSDLPEDMPSEEDLENKVKKNKHKLELIGMVNMAVKDEYESEDSRLKFLTEQRDDLLESEKGINEVIDRIDNIAREQYLEVFAQINENFKSTFNLFFDGGEADLKLMDNEEPLDAQIEIFACPTGKKMRSLKMLSAGEKTLTAIALLFGIYQVKPSPFCILDEVDAPLDDSNTRRFTRMIKAFSDKTQFIIVTHNKVTMSVGDVLYGVTMGERGVSQVVSVKMNQM